MATTDIRHALDPVAFARDALGFDPDPWQSTVLRSPSKRLLLNCCRQSGKSTPAAAVALHTALYRPRALVLLVSPSLRQSAELFRKVSDHIDQLDAPPDLDEDNRLSLSLPNGSRIVSLPGSEATVRGFSGPMLVVEDEASRVEDDLYRAIRPMLAVSDGRLVLMSTPFGKRGHFYEEWTNGGGEWLRIEIPATDCPRITPAFLDGERRALGPLWFSQEYECIFAETEDAVFRHADIEAAISTDLKPLFGEVSI